jgi:hypothetical protein
MKNLLAHFTIIALIFAVFAFATWCVLDNFATRLEKMQAHFCDEVNGVVLDGKTYSCRRVSD